MRISDWSTDVCSSDLIRTLLSLWANTGRASAEVKRLALARADEFQRKAEALTALRDTLIDLAERCQGDERPDCPIIAELAAARSASHPESQDRKSVVQGKRVSVRLDLGGSRLHKKKKTKH